jgi:hypothetical protein
LPSVRCVIPAGLPSFHPCYTDPALRARIRRQFHRDRIFLNIPYAARYTTFELAIISTTTAYGLIPVMAKQRARFEVRLRKLVEMIYSSGSGLTDLSYTTRLNMPFELGLMLALGKNVFIVSRRPYSALRSISDLSLGDIAYHRGDPRRLIRQLAGWIEENCSTKHIELAPLYSRFQVFVRLRRYLGSAEFDRLSPQQISEMIRSLQRRQHATLIGTAP